VVNDQHDTGKSDRSHTLYKEAVDSFGTALARLARSYEFDSDKQGDLLQDIHLALWRSFDGFDERCSLRTWVYRIAHNVAASYVIKNKRIANRVVSLEDLNFTPATAGSESVDKKMALDRLLGLIQQLSLIDHAIVVLYLEGEDAASIAGITGLTAKNVATKIHRIKNLLAKKFHKGGSHE
jgi:RNA polymerase sigma-70 factor, ECF subfamily